MTKYLLLIVCSLLFASNAYGWTVDCDAYDSDTGAYVYGECVDGDFEGYNSSTGAYVYGDCERGGDVDAYDSNTSAYVYGDCED
jgi:hypothetical protein